MPSIQDWLSSTVLGDATLGDVAGAGLNAYDTYQKSEAGQDIVNKIDTGYTQGINCAEPWWRIKGHS